MGQPVGLLYAEGLKVITEVSLGEVGDMIVGILWYFLSVSFV